MHEISHLETQAFLVWMYLKDINESNINQRLKLFVAF
jgi:hypothetical protein